MDVMLQGHEAKLVFPVPDGLRELASDITREVLRSQPTNIYEFIADYCDALLKTRQNAIVAAEMIDDLLEHDVTFEALLEKRGINIKDAKHASIIIQAAFRGYYTRCKLKSQEKVGDPFLSKLGIDEEVVKRAIVKIQAAFRGHCARKRLRTTAVLPTQAIGDQVDHSSIILEILERSGTSWEAANEAATKIQKVFREYSIWKSHEERPPGEPQEEGHRRRKENVSETKNLDHLQDRSPITDASAADSKAEDGTYSAVGQVEYKDSEATSTDYVESETEDEQENILGSGDKGEDVEGEEEEITNEQDIDNAEDKNNPKVEPNEAESGTDAMIKDIKQDIIEDDREGIKADTKEDPMEVAQEDDAIEIIKEDLIEEIKTNENDAIEDTKQDNEKEFREDIKEDENEDPKGDTGEE